MNDVRMVCANLLDGPEPPRRSADEVLRYARRAKRRRDVRVAASLSGVAAAVAAAVVVVLSGQSGGPPDRLAGPAAPVAQAPASHGRQLAERLVAAVPSGYAAVVETTFSDSDTVYPTVPRANGPRLLAGAVVRVFTGPREGQLYAYLLYDGRSVPAGDLCSGTAAGAQCEVRAVAGVQVRIVNTADGERGQVVEATRFLAGGRLIVGSAQAVTPGLDRYVGSQVYQPAQSMVDPPIGAAGMAALAADPAMLPGP